MPPRVDRRRIGAAPTHSCPDPGCSVTDVPQRHFACPNDWARLDDDLRQDILDGYRTRRRDDGVAHRAAMLAAVNWYRSHPLTGRPTPTRGARGAQASRVLIDEPWR